MSIKQLEKELILKIFENIEENAADVQCLRLTCKYLHDTGNNIGIKAKETTISIPAPKTSSQYTFRPNISIWNSKLENMDFVKRNLRDYNNASSYEICGKCHCIKHTSNFPLRIKKGIDLFRDGHFACGECLFFQCQDLENIHNAPPAFYNPCSTPFPYEKRRGRCPHCRRKRRDYAHHVESLHCFVKDYEAHIEQCEEAKMVMIKTNVNVLEMRKFWVLVYDEVGRPSGMFKRADNKLFRTRLVIWREEGELF